MKSFAGIGSRQITKEEEKRIAEISAVLSSLGYVCYSGGAEGSDYIFEQSCKETIVFIPWNNYKNPFKTYIESSNIIVAGNTIEGNESVFKFHPAPNRLSQGGKKLMCRNYHQIHGMNSLPKVELVVCCAHPDKNFGVKGGTGQAIRVALSENIPIFNIRTMKWINRKHPDISFEFKMKGE